MINIVIVAVIAIVVGAALTYIIRAKKNGAKCIGCPHSKDCGGSCGCKTNK